MLWQSCSAGFYETDAVHNFPSTEFAPTPEKQIKIPYSVRSEAHGQTVTNI